MSAAAEPTGAQLLREIENAARARGVQAQELAKKLSPYPTNWLRQLGAAARPKPNTIERVRALIAGERVPPPDLTNAPSAATVAKTHAQRALLELLISAADVAAPCPSNSQLAANLGFKGSTSARDLVRSLEAQGLIVVRRFAKARQVTIVATGRSTAIDEDEPPIATIDGGTKQRSAPAPTAEPEPAPLDFAEAEPASPDPRPYAFSRDPCPRCAARGDLGCAHQQPFKPLRMSR